MATRSIIGVYTNIAERQWRGTYHHWDGYPSGLGKELWSIYHRYYEGILSALVEYLIDANPHGWSSIVRCDFTQRPSWLNWSEKQAYYDENRPIPPQSYKARGEEPDPLDETSDRGHEWAYVFDLRAETMTILKREGYEPMYYIHKATIPLEGIEPDWTAFEA